MLDETQRLALETLEMNKQAIIFAPSRASAEKTAEDLSLLTNFNFLELEKAVLHALSAPTKQCRRLSHCIKKGVAFHHSGLTGEQRDLIEKEFRKGTVKIICATPTLAAGVSTPAFRVIIKSLKRFNENWGMEWIPVLEYLQMSGRAGRPEFENWGEAIVIAKDKPEKEEIHQRYICGLPDEIDSKLAVEPVLRTYLLSLIASGIINDLKSLKDFFKNTFWAYQFQDMPKLESIMEKMLQLLEAWQFVEVQGTPQSGLHNEEFIA
ncbi:ATP-dependent DNA helicase, partial [Candidatus Woesearchaeota archaeon]|nr:ATP-dependent DNA helicase [Candidatus Woesearchaeota archaeon]